jgi:hypothetical protein
MVFFDMVFFDPRDVKRDPTLIEQLVCVCARNVGAEHAVFEQGMLEMSNSQNT